MSDDTVTLTRPELAELIASAVALGVSRALSSKAQQAPRSLSLTAAAKAYKVGTDRLKAMVAAGLLEARRIPGRGKGGQEIRLSTAALDAAFVKATA